MGHSLKWDNTQHVCNEICGYIGYGIGYQYRMNKEEITKNKIK
jgi:hypothetical protein